MTECWKYDPRERPTFSVLVTSLLPDMDDLFKQVR